MNFHHIFVFLKKQTKTTRGTTHMQLHILKLLSAKLSNYINCDNVWHTTILQSNNQNRSVIFFFFLSYRLLKNIHAWLCSPLSLPQSKPFSGFYDVHKNAFCIHSRLKTSISDASPTYKISFREL